MRRVRKEEGIQVREIMTGRNVTCTASKTRPELAAAVGVTGHNWGGRHAAWISGRPRKCFIGAAVGG